MSTDPRDRAARRVGLAFAVTVLAALGLAATYAAGGQPQVEGALLFTGLGSLGIGFVLLARHLLPPGPYVEERAPLASSAEEQHAFGEDFRTLTEGEPSVARRRFILRMLTAAAAALGVAALFPIRSLGPGPGSSLARTAWRRGRRVVDERGEPVDVGTLEVGGAITVFPEGHVGSATAQVILVRVSATDFTTRPGREAWGPHGYLAFSKICTHAGCPVGLYQQSFRRLLCPCHQSTFEVAKGAEPVFGPATRSLPQLPLVVGAGGWLEARSDFHEPVGPGYWSRG